MTTIRWTALAWVVLPAASAAAGQVYYTKDYYPVAPNARWLHQEESKNYDGREDSFPTNRRVLPDQVVVGGVTTTVVERNAFGRTYAEDFLTTTAGLTMHKQVWHELDQNGLPVQYPLYLTPGLSFAPAAMRVGDTWSFTSNVSGWNSELGYYSGTTRMDGKLAGIETVSVKAGTFVNALRIDAVYTSDVTGQQGSRRTATNTMSAWLAKDVGFVKDTESITQTQGGQTRTWQYALELLAGPQQIKVIPGVPEYRWNYGCGPTSAAMILGYYDRQAAYANLVPGFQMPDKDWADRDGDGDAVGHDSAPAVRKDRYGQALREGTRGTGNYHSTANPTGYSPLDKVIASEEHVRDYWYGDVGATGRYDDAHQKTGAGDPWRQMTAQPHVDNCLADYMACSKGTQKDGWIAHPDDVISALDKWATRNGFKSTSFKKTYGTYDQMFGFIKDHIDQGRPLALRWPGHFVVCDGYLDGEDDYDWLAIHDTWMDGESNEMPFLEDGGKTYRVDGMYPGETEWWRFRVTSNTLGFVTHAIAWQPLLPGQKATAYGELFGDSFDRPPDDAGLGGGYAVTASSPGGAAEIVASPFDAEDPVLRLVMPEENGFVAIHTDVAVADRTAIGFDYLFETDGKLSVMLDGRTLAEIACPASGPGGVGAERFASFYEVFPLADLGFDTAEMLRLTVQLSHAGDPAAYLDNLTVWGIEPVPEPATHMLALLGLFGLLGLHGAFCRHNVPGVGRG